MPKVQRPYIHEISPHPGKPAPTGPRNLVEELEVVPFDEFGGAVEGWSGEGSLVLSLWTEIYQNPPARFCLSPAGAQVLGEALQSALPQS